MSVRVLTPRTTGLAGDRRLQLWTPMALVLAALGLQMFLPTLLPALHLMNLPLLVGIYLVLRSRAVVSAMLIGMFIGWAQDGLTHGPFGIYGAVYTCIGYLGATASQFVRVDLPLVWGGFAALAYLLHEAMLYLIHVYLLGQVVVFEFGLWASLAVLHSGLALLTYPLFGRLTGAR